MAGRPDLSVCFPFHHDNAMVPLRQTLHVSIAMQKLLQGRALAPSAPSASAIALPMPREDPVTTATSAQHRK